MASNIQISYWKLKEDQRANHAREAHNSAELAETANHNRETERVARGDLLVKQGTLAETMRSNQAREYETSRSNVAREQETARSNRANESLGYATLAETMRSNQAREAETAIHNRASERAADTQAAARQTAADASMQSALTKQQELDLKKDGNVHIKTGAANFDIPLSVLQRAGVLPSTEEIGSVVNSKDMTKAQLNKLDELMNAAKEVAKLGKFVNPPAVWKWPQRFHEVTGDIEKYAGKVGNKTSDFFKFWSDVLNEFKKTSK